jgi:hypothetical protein
MYYTLDLARAHQRDLHREAARDAQASGRSQSGGPRRTRRLVLRKRDDG